MADQCYFSGDYYQCISDTNAGESPSSAPSKWYRIPILAKWRYALAQLAYAELLRQDGQTDKSALERQAAYQHDRYGLYDLIRSEAQTEEFDRNGSRAYGAMTTTGRSGHIKASVILDDIYRLHNWDPDQLESREKMDARRAFSFAMQEVWDSWWWRELMTCEQLQFAETLAAATAYSQSTTVYDPANEAYYTALDAASSPPITLPDANWEEYEPNKATLNEWSDEAIYEAFDQFQYANVGYQCVLDGAAAGTLPTDTTYFKPLSNWHPILPYTTEADVTEGPNGPIRSVSQFDPRSAQNPTYYSLDTQGEQTRVINMAVSHPWVWSRQVTPIITGDDYDATATYEASDEYSDLSPEAPEARELYDGIWSDPNGRLIPDEPGLPALYKQRGTAVPNVWAWDTTDQVWYGLVTP